jgi:hypothetical protein
VITSRSKNPARKITGFCSRKRNDPAADFLFTIAGTLVLMVEAERVFYQKFWQPEAEVFELHLFENYFEVSSL